LDRSTHGHDIDIGQIRISTADGLQAKTIFLSAYRSASIRRAAGLIETMNACGTQQNGPQSLETNALYRTFQICKSLSPGIAT